MNNLFFEKVAIKSLLIDLYDVGILPEQENDNFKIKFYSPSIYIQIALFIATVAGLAFVAGFMFLLFNFSNVVFILAAIISVLIFFWSLKAHHYNSGIDNASLYMSIAFFNIFFAANFSISITLISLLVAVTCATAAFLLKDRFLAIAAFLSLLYYLVNLNLLNANLVLLAVSLVLFIFSALAGRNCSVSNDKIFSTLKYVSSFFAAISPSIVFEGKYFLYAPAGFLPVLLIFFAVKLKNLLLLRTGILALLFNIASIIFLFSGLKFYGLFCLVSVLILLLCIVVIKILNVPKSGFVCVEIDEVNNAETVTPFLPENSAAGEFKYGGGSFGGGGASGSF